MKAVETVEKQGKNPPKLVYYTNTQSGETDAGGIRLSIIKRVHLTVILIVGITSRASR